MALSLTELLSAARTAGFTGASAYMAAAIAYAESAGNQFARNTAGNSAGTDRGLWQINSYYHPEVTDACADSILCSAQQAFRISKGGTDWSQWSTFKNGSFQKYYGELLGVIGAAPAPGTATATAPAPRGNGAGACGGDCSLTNLSGCITLAGCQLSAVAKGYTWEAGLLALAAAGIYLVFRR